MGESASARTQRELADLRGAIGRDVDALAARAREDADPRNLARRRPLAVLGSLASVAVAAAIGIARRAREGRTAETRLDVVLERVGGRLDKLKGKARGRVREQLRKELARAKATGPKEVAIGVASAALTTLATTVARELGGRLLSDEVSEEEAAGRER